MGPMRFVGMVRWVSTFALVMALAACGGDKPAAEPRETPTQAPLVVAPAPESTPAPVPTARPAPRLDSAALQDRSNPDRLLRYYAAALHARDCEGDGFEWLIADDRENSVFAWVRKAPGEKPVAVVTNFTPVYREGYAVPLPVEGRWREILNTDAEIYGGSGKGNGGAVVAQRNEHGGISATIILPPLATVMFELD